MSLTEMKVPNSKQWYLGTPSSSNADFQKLKIKNNKNECSS